MIMHTARTWPPPNMTLSWVTPFWQQRVSTGISDLVNQAEGHVAVELAGLDQMLGEAA